MKARGFQGGPLPPRVIARRNDEAIQTGASINGLLHCVRNDGKYGRRAAPVLYACYLEVTSELRKR